MQNEPHWLKRIDGESFNEYIERNPEIPKLLRDKQASKDADIAKTRRSHFSSSGGYGDDA